MGPWLTVAGLRRISPNSWNLAVVLTMPLANPLGDCGDVLRDAPGYCLRDVSAAHFGPLIAATELERRRDHQRMHQLAIIDSATVCLSANFNGKAHWFASPAERTTRFGVLLLDINARFKDIQRYLRHRVGRSNC